MTGRKSIVLSLLIVSYPIVLSQQLTSLTDGIVKPLAGNQPDKVGLAPHNRPSCQVQLSSSSSSPTSTTSSLGNLVSSLNQRRSGQQSNAGDELIKSPIIIDNSNNKTTTTNQPKLRQETINNQHEQNSLRAFDSSERIRQLRQLLSNNNYDAYLVTPNDEHGSEYVTEYDRRLKFISGFTGSNGFALILMDKAVLFTDGRYALQADHDLDCNWWLVVGEEPEADIYLWLRSQNLKNLKIATDARLMTLQTFELLDDGLRKLDSEFALISQDLVDIVWNNFQTNAEDPYSSARVAPRDPLFVHQLRFTGNISWQEKLVMLAESMEKLKARHYIISSLDDIGWLLNLRGNDIPMTPLFKAYLFISLSPNFQQTIITSQRQNVDQLQLIQQSTSTTIQSPQVVQVQPNQIIRVTLYIDLKKVTPQIRDHLHLDNGTLFTNNKLRRDTKTPVSQTTRIQLDLKDYDVFIMDIRDRLNPTGSISDLPGSSGSGSTLSGANRGFSSVQQHQQGKLLLDAKANVAIHVLAKNHDDRMIMAESLIAKLKSVKTDAEVQGMRLAHWRDSLAISMLLAQLEEDIEKRGDLNKWTETLAAKELEMFRSLMDYNKGQSFPSISAYGAQAAIVHYQPREEDNIFIKNESTYLLDTGGQYLDGTTDITRTAHFGRPTNFQCETYTRVLMGAVDMMSVVWEQSSRSSFRLNDLMARRHLFELGLDYKHGTGHGIGLYSLVHENPRLIEHYATSSTRAASRGGGGGSSTQGNRQPETGRTEPALNSDLVLLQPNMFSSVEPGYYKANDFGIRLENIVVTQRISLPGTLIRQNDRSTKDSPPTGAHVNSANFLRFEPISLVPFEPKLIKFELLSNKQKAWLNSYNLMVRLRMTQQINYYLTKLRDTSSQLNIPTSLLSNRTLSDGYYNFMAMAPELFREKLERAHKWILAKTELIPLDVPQALVALGGERVIISNNKPTSSTPSTSNGQRLMLTYMSSLPFDDHEAAEAVLSLMQESHLNGRQENSTNGKQSSSSIGLAAKKEKCVGLECDLWLLEAMNSIQTSANNYQLKSKSLERDSSSSSMPTTWSESLVEGGIEGSDGFANDRNLLPASLMDLFQLAKPTKWLFGFNMWPLFIMFFLICLQLSIMAYICRCRSRGSSGGRFRSGSGISRGESCIESDQLNSQRLTAAGSGCCSTNRRRSSGHSSGCCRTTSRRLSSVTPPPPPPPPTHQSSSPQTQASV